MENNQIKNIPDEAFWGCEKLTTVHLENNQIQAEMQIRDLRAKFEQLEKPFSYYKDHMNFTIQLVRNEFDNFLLRQQAQPLQQLQPPQQLQTPQQSSLAQKIPLAEPANNLLYQIIIWIIFIFGNFLIGVIIAAIIALFDEAYPMKHFGVVTI